jgi:hypothetical protein
MVATSRTSRSPALVGSLHDSRSGLGDQVRPVHEASDRDDVATILDAVTEDVDWASETTSTVAPWYGIRHGKDDVAASFQD